MKTINCGDFVAIMQKHNTTNYDVILPWANHQDMILTATRKELYELIQRLTACVARLDEL